MPPRTIDLRPDRWRTALGVAVASMVATSTADAHFVLQAPLCYSQQDFLGLPEKSAPCGQDDPGTPMVPTGMATAFIEGQTMTVTIQEVIFHPGHYRISIANDPSGLPADPVVTVGATPCGSAAIETTPTMPVLVDDALDHTAPFSGPQSIQVTLPPGFTCTNCVLQVVEFMGDHPLNVPGGCFYHHCANISVVSSEAGVVIADAGSTTPDAGTAATDVPSRPDVQPSVPAATASHGCSCTTVAATHGECGLGGLSIAAGLGMLRRRRRSITSFSIGKASRT